MASGGRAFVVFPMIEESKEFPEMRSAVREFELLTSQSGPLHDFPCGLLHGKMPPTEKEAAMDAFRSGQIKVRLA